MRIRGGGQGRLARLRYIRAFGRRKSDRSEEVVSLEAASSRTRGVKSAKMDKKKEGKKKRDRDWNFSHAANFQNRIPGRFTARLTSRALVLCPYLAEKFLVATKIRSDFSAKTGFFFLPR